MLFRSRVDAYRDELTALQQSLEQSASEGGDNDKITRNLLATIDTRLTEILPCQTSWDQAYEFFVQP